MPRRRGPSFDQYLVSQIPLTLAVALIFGLIAFASIRSMPTRGTAGGTAAPVAPRGGGTLITAFAGGTATQQIPIAADPTGALKWDRVVYEARAGDVTFVVTNKSSSSHNFAVEGPGVTAQGPNFGANTTTTYTLRDLKPGEYQLVCNFPGHKAAGMVAKLVVK